MVIDMAKFTRILSIDGGGLRGLIPAQVLVYVEQRIQEKTGNPAARIADYFDLFAGTSAGGFHLAYI
jgi:patatin-like phospholipase/acyl hydrolase